MTDGTVGSRPLIKYGTGTLLITGAATYTGGTTIEDGTLQLGSGITAGSILGNVTFCTSIFDSNCNTSSGKFLVFDQPTAYTFNGVISGLGTITQEGAGALTLTADSSGFAGSTKVTGGGLIIGPDSSPNAKLGGSVTVQNGAFVAGHGTIGGSLFNPSGIVASTGAAVPLKVGGDYVQGAAGTLLVGLSPTAATKLAVSGAVSLAGTLDIQATPGNAGYVPFSKFKIVTAGFGVDGTFGSVTGTLPILPLSIKYLANEVDIQLGGFSGANANEQAVANALNVAFPNATGDFASVLDTVVNLSPTRMQQALSSFGGQIYANLAEVSLQDRRLFLGAMDERLRLIAGDSPSAAVLGSLPGGAFPGPWGHGANATQLAAIGTALSDANGDMIPDPVGLAAASATAQAQPPTLAANNMWVRGFGQFGSTSGDAGAFGSNFSTGGGAIGADLINTHDRLVGVALGGGHSSITLNTNPETGTISFFEVGAYGAQALGSGFAFDGAGVFAHDYYDVSRGILFGGTRRNATSNHGGNDEV
ncbi:MAG TPA: autotransporter domain-containing protein, partial [Stellaceae bacterium]|nr:autotransporter domain-containing protein [Stellaceae bacterium]